MPALYILLVTLLAISFSSSVTLAQVPRSKTFNYVNTGEFGEYIIEYDANYRIITTDNYNFFSHPYRLCFYNTTPNAFIFAIKAGVANDEDLMRWVWDANRNNPVGENATLSLGRDGNLILAEADGQVKWQTNTANKGVTGIRMMPTGNLVLHDKKGRFVWQSFDHPTDTLLTGQSLRSNGVHKLVSRTSDADPSDGPYSLELGKSVGLIMYVNKTGKPLEYNGWRTMEFHGSVTFDVLPENDKNTAYELVIRPGEPPATPPPGSQRRLLQSRPISNGNALILKKVNYNATLSFLRLGSDGSIKAFTYYNDVGYLKWDESFAYFSNYYVRQCGLPSWCGDYGYCDNGMCVACPTPKGLLGWSQQCSPPKTTQFCGEKGKKATNYYKIVGVEHFLGTSMDDGEGPLAVGDCKAKCDRDCKCLGYFYKEDTKKCLLAPLLGTLIKDVNTSVGYIKY